MKLCYSLNKCTLVIIDCVDPDLALKAVLYSIKEVQFASILFFSHKKPKDYKAYSDLIEYIPTKKFNYNEFRWFKIKELPNFIKTPYCLFIESDGFIINPGKWDNCFYNYDYIGAPWLTSKIGHYQYLNENNRVGNGGFSLRSKEFLDISKNEIPYQFGESEDTAVCRKYRDIFLNNNIKYAPVKVALNFSIERSIEELPKNHRPFGFHGIFRKKIIEICLGKQHVIQD